ncbi:MAG: phosphomannomutase/phosphoglucomutase [Candidatus Pelagibacter sp.]|nr:phosphomannomutase/phosphoglucomutase [Candidatus Pelagibacter sp.]OUV87363.1 MAG: phosphomannomutase/phosphoglucomutase [Pelagibacteraceae bacterium TMED136]|tara:strand:- start:2506 stop:3963 length:1458 start_codon:yes stop_codon:yes gene_type:complete
MPDSSVHINHNGFREYDARWLYPKDINLAGIKNLGHGLGTQIVTETKKQNPRVIVGYDYRSYSEEIKDSLADGLIAAGCYVEDLGLSLSPMAYFAQFELDADGVAMVTASHNENGWTGVKMGIKKGLTHAPDEMAELKKIVLNKQFINGKGKLKKIENFISRYKKNLIEKNKIKKKIKAVVACGNGTAGIFAPDILKGIGCEVIEMDCNLDFNFPKYNPNPEDLKMLHAISKVVKDNKADIGFGFDGDGDRVGVIDNNGQEIFSDKIGLLISRNLAPQYPNSKFIIDVKSTGLFSQDQILKDNNCETILWKTGHSHIKRKVHQEKALAGFEKSGHFFFNQPLGLGYDDGINSAIQVCHLLSNKNKEMNEIVKELPTTYQTPTMAPYCKDEEKYNVVDEMINKFKNFRNSNTLVDGQEIKDILTVNGIRFTLNDGSWGLVRASSNKPSLVVVTESPTSEKRKKAIFDFIDHHLQSTGKIGKYDQKI